jgi:hypothetical protein
VRIRGADESIDNTVRERRVGVYTTLNYNEMLDDIDRLTGVSRYLIN